VRSFPEQRPLPEQPTALQDRPPVALPLQQVKGKGKGKARAADAPPRKVKANSQANGEQKHPLMALLAQQGHDLEWKDIIPNYSDMGRASREDRKKRFKDRLASGNYGNPLEDLLKKYKIPLLARPT
jgi:hypothetical protein